MMASLPAIRQVRAPFWMFWFGVPMVLVGLDLRGAYEGIPTLAFGGVVVASGFAVGVTALLIVIAGFRYGRPEKRMFAVNMMGAAVVATVVGWQVGVQGPSILPGLRSLFVLGGYVLGTAGQFLSFALIRVALEWEDTTAPPRIHLPPASGVRRVLAFVCTKKVMSRVFDPVIAEIQNEWYEAVRDGRERLAGWVFVRGLIIVLWTVLFYVVMSFARAAVDMWKLLKP